MVDSAGMVLRLFHASSPPTLNSHIPDLSTRDRIPRLTECPGSPQRCCVRAQFSRTRQE
ncbi:MAG: hypothetical protein QNJ46_06325 [Leptolyngbyaceae cyanobacterium MO_188.B28]|nr:hypothetical protein [Leptolyngbyaceae cyanobacterium MO_188.B28]